MIGGNEQLSRLIPVHQGLRERGYRTPEIISCGKLPGDRCYLLTAWIPGNSPRTPTRRHLEAALDAADYHREVGPPEERDWSAMVTLFLNGGIRQHQFHRSVESYARQALELLPKPVPALPTGDLVHGDFTFQNMLFNDDSLSGVIDLEGFGRGTVAIDLIALLPSLPDLADRHLVVERATRLTSADVVTTCLCHRVLAGLDWASQHEEQRGDAIAQAKHLLALLP